MKTGRFQIILLAGLAFLLSSHLACSQTADTEKTVRLPAVAGKWYPKKRAVLADDIDKYLVRNIPEPAVNEKIVALISPHAGFMYSGGVAAGGYNLIKGKKFDKVIAVGLSHRYPLEFISACDVDSYRTPLGDVPVDRGWIKRMKKNIPLMSYIPKAHSEEHSVEAQVPFLQEVLGEFKFVEVLVNKAGEENIKALDVIFEDAYKNNYLIVVSTDLSHYHPYDAAVKMDNKTIKYVLDKDVVGLAGAFKNGNCEACGSTGLLGITAFAKKHNFNTRLVQYKNSGDVTGDHSQGVVGYASIILTESKVKEAIVKEEHKGLEQMKILTKAEEDILLDIARTTLQKWVFDKKVYEPPVPDADVLKKKGAAFVTLQEKGNLRGCIGTVIPVKPLYLCIRDNAINAASKDPRFPAVNKKEYEDIDIEISVMSPLQKVNSSDEIKVGRDGLILRKGFYQGVFLPQVPVEWKWDKVTYLEQLCRKAGLSDKNAWKDKDTELLKFGAQVFSEK